MSSSRQINAAAVADPHVATKSSIDRQSSDSKQQSQVSATKPKAVPSKEGLEGVVAGESSICTVALGSGTTPPLLMDHHYIIILTKVESLFHEICYS